MKKKYIKYLLVIILIISLLFIRPFTNALKDTIIGFGSIITKPFNRIIINQNNNYEDEIKKLEKENAELKKAMDIDNNLDNMKKINANVVIRNINSWYNTITIDKGKSSGIKRGQAVISENGLIGSIADLTDKTSTIRLLTSNDLRRKISVAINIENNYLYGLLTNYNNFYKVESITDNTEIPVGSTVYTTGFGNLFPAGLRIGTVDRVEKDQFDLARIVYVKPVSNLENINYVGVISND